MRVAIVGAGQMAGEHLNALGRVRAPHLVVGVCDTDHAAALALGARAGARAYTSLRRLLQQERPNLVHVCTPARTHHDPCRAALEAGAHVYVEKPFVETAPEARELVDLAAERNLLICAGHQQVRDPSFVRLMHRLPAVGRAVHVDSHFAFHRAGLDRDTAGPRAQAAQLLDVLPHPLSTLLAALERATAGGQATELTMAVAEPGELVAVVRRGGVIGRLTVSLRSRPVASTVAVSGTSGTLSADFIRTSVVGAANAGTGPLEKALNPLLEAWQSGVGGTLGVARRLLTGNHYPGLAELLGDFYAAAAGGGASPLSRDHLLEVSALYEELAANVRAAAESAVLQRAAFRPSPERIAPVAVLTGAGGFFGREIAGALASRGFRVRGLGRSADPGDPHIHEWRRLDLSREMPPDVLADAQVVVHAAAASQGGYASHQRDTIDVTRNLLSAMRESGCARLVHVSSLSVLRPPRKSREIQDENTPLAGPDARDLGPYTWGKTESERLVAGQVPAFGIAVRIVRPAALVDYREPDLPGLLGRRLLGKWHLGLGRRRLPFAACEVRRAAAVVAWCASRFEEAPQTINLLEPGLATRGDLLDAFRKGGWQGRLIWVPISAFSGMVTAARWALSLAARRMPHRVRVWAVLRPRRYDRSVSARALAAAARQPLPERRPTPVERRISW